MNEQKNGEVPGQPEGEEWRPPPPYIGLPVLIMVFMTAATIFYTVALLVIQEHQGLRYTLAALTLTPILCGWWVLVRSRRQDPVMPSFLVPVSLGVVAMPYLSRVLLNLADGQPVDVFDGLFLVAFLVTFLLFLLRHRLPPPFSERQPR